MAAAITFPKMEIPIVKSENGGLAQIAKSLKESLGYGHLDSLIETNSQEAKFLSVLNRLDCLPFETNAVERYMRRRKWAINLKRHNIVLLLLCLGLILFGIGGFLSGDWPNSIAIWSASSVFLFLIWGFYWNIIKDENRFFDWNQTPLQFYRDAIPLTVLKKAEEIKNEWPNATFAVSELSARQRVDDPFLIVWRERHMNTASFRPIGKPYYIAVWEEPTFNG